jgi:predicted RNase H-like HicB family nuclease
MTTGRSALTLTLEIVIERDDPGYHAFCPALPGLHAPGDTEEEAVENAVAAARLFIASMIAHGDPLPPPYSSLSMV